MMKEFIDGLPTLFKSREQSLINLTFLSPVLIKELKLKLKLNLKLNKFWVFKSN